MGTGYKHFFHMEEEKADIYKKLLVRGNL